MLLVGKTEDKNLKALIEEYHKRIQKYHRFDIEIIPEIKNSKNLSQSLQKSKEGKLIIKKTKAGDCIILLDENGKQYDSHGFSKYIEKKRKNLQKSIPGRNFQKSRRQIRLIREVIHSISPHHVQRLLLRLAIPRGI